MSVMSLVMLVNLLSVSVVGSTPYFAIPPRAHLAFPHLLSAPTPGLSASVLLVPLNHTDAAPTEHISLRYWVDDSCFKPGGPLLAHLGGEGEQGPVGCSQQARDLKALVLSIEHRFYGKSWLTNRSLSESLSLEYLQHLNVRNALTDSKMVIEHVLARYESSNKVVSLGGSYSGSLSAFLRMEYPETVLGSVSESGVVSAVLDFPGFDEAILSAASISAQHSRGGDPCGERLQNATYAMERIAAGENGPSQLLAIFNGSTLKDLNDFWYAVADGPAMLIQYGSKSVLCDALEAAPWDGSDQAIAAYLAQIISHKYGDFFVAGCFYDSSCWGSAQKSAAASSSPMERQWRFQKCNEMAFLQGAPASGSIRSSSLTLGVLEAQCVKAFGAALGRDPMNARIRARYGSFRPTGSNVFFFDYSDDPWRAATVDRDWVASTGAKQNLQSCYTSCNGCGHCGAGVPPNLTHCEQRANDWLVKLLGS